MLWKEAAAERVLWLCAGRDRSLQCSRSVLKSSTTSKSDLRFCHEHAPSGSTVDSDQTPTHQPADGGDGDGGGETAVAELSRARRSTDDAAAIIAADFDDASYLFVLRSLVAGSGGDRASLMLASIYAVPRGAAPSCRTPGCDAPARDTGYCVGCSYAQAGASSLPALESPGEDPAAASCVDVRGSSEPSAAEGDVELGARSQSGELASAGDITSEQLAGSSSSSRSTAAACSEDVDVKSRRPGRDCSADVPAGTSEGEVDAGSLSPPAEVTSADTTATSISSHQWRSATERSQCRGPHCSNAGDDDRRGLCVSCYSTLYNYNYRLMRRRGVASSAADADAD